MADRDQKLDKPRRRGRKVQPDKPLAVVGIGVCSDSLHSLEVLFASLGPDLGAAYVIAVRQLEGLSVETVVKSLSRRGTLPVKVAEDGETLEPNRIYVGGPNDMVTLEDGTLRTRPATEP